MTTVVVGSVVVGTVGTSDVGSVVVGTVGTSVVGSVVVGLFIKIGGLWSGSSSTRGFKRHWGRTSGRSGGIGTVIQLSYAKRLRMVILF